MGIRFRFDPKRPFGKSVSELVTDLDPHFLRRIMVEREQRKELLEVIGIISIVASLIFVALEIRQNTNAAHSAVVQSLTDQSIVMSVLAAEDEPLRQALRAARAGTETSDQRAQVNIFYGLGLRVTQNRYMQMKQGVASMDTILATGADSPMYLSEDFKRWWEADRQRFMSDDFIDFMENVMMADPAE